MAAYKDLVSVTIVTYNSGRFIKRCLESVLEQKYPNLEVVIIDNASNDGTVDILEPFAETCRIYYNDENIGFAAAQNQAIALAQGEWVLTLNPDVLLLPNFVQALVDAGNLDPKIGTVCGKLLTILSTFDLPEKQLVDSTGIYFTPMLRHLDRGSQEIDNGHYLNFEYVFGATAAAALYRRQMIEDISIVGEFFDPDFFVYREDADVAWRAQLMGWSCIYAPLARGYSFEGSIRLQHKEALWEPSWLPEGSDRPSRRAVREERGERGRELSPSRWSPLRRSPVRSGW
jgi:GT2 family glycosyltransferase